MGEVLLATDTSSSQGHGLSASCLAKHSSSAVPRPRLLGGHKPGICCVCSCASEASQSSGTPPGTGSFGWFWLPFEVMVTHATLACGVHCTWVPGTAQGESCCVKPGALQRTFPPPFSEDLQPVPLVPLCCHLAPGSLAEQLCCSRNSTGKNRGVSRLGSCADCDLIAGSAGAI